jgi:hypothetical protein
MVVRVMEGEGRQGAQGGGGSVARGGARLLVPEDTG